MKASKSYFVLSLHKGGCPLEVAHDQYNLFCDPIFLLYHALSFFIPEGSPHLVSEHFPWHKWEFFFFGKKRANWAATFTSIFETFCVDSRETSCISEFLFQKYAVSKKTSFDLEF